MLRIAPLPIGRRIALVLMVVVFSFASLTAAGCSGMRNRAVESAPLGQYGGSGTVLDAFTTLSKNSQVLSAAFASRAISPHRARRLPRELNSYSRSIAANPRG